MYNIDFRRLVLDFKNKHHLTFEETSERFGISIRSLFRWEKSIEPCSSRPRDPSKIQNQTLLDDIKNYPDAYLKERAQRLGVSISGIHDAMKRLNITRKKNFRTQKG